MREAQEPDSGPPPGPPAGATEVQTEVVDRLLHVAKRVADEGGGTMLVVADAERVEPRLKTHFPQMRYDGTVLDDGFDVVLARLAALDGAVAVTPEGRLIAYGARLTTHATLPGFGTRHAAAKGYSEHDPDATVILTSEETGWTKVFQEGRVVLEIDPSDVEPSVLRKLSRYVVSKDAAILAAAGISAATLGLGTAALLILGGSYVVVRGATETLTGILKGSGERRERRGPE